MKGYTHIIAFALGVLTAYGLYKIFLEPEYVDSVTSEYKEEIKLVVKDTTIITYKDSLRVLQVEATPSEEPEKYDSVRTYEGAIKFDYGAIKWKAQTLGALSKLEISPTLILPEKTVTKSTTTERTYRNKALFLGGAIDSRMQFKAGAYYVNNKLLVGYEIEPLTRESSVRVGFRIFGK